MPTDRQRLAERLEKAATDLADVMADWRYVLRTPTLARQQQATIDGLREAAEWLRRDKDIAEETADLRAALTRILYDHRTVDEMEREARMALEGRARP